MSYFIQAHIVRVHSYSSTPRTHAIARSSHACPIALPCFPYVQLRTCTLKGIDGWRALERSSHSFLVIDMIGYNAQQMSPTDKIHQLDELIQAGAPAHLQMRAALIYRYQCKSDESSIGVVTRAHHTFAVKPVISQAFAEPCLGLGGQGLLRHSGRTGSRQAQGKGASE